MFWSFLCVAISTFLCSALSFCLRLSKWTFCPVHMNAWRDWEAPSIQCQKQEQNWHPQMSPTSRGGGMADRAPLASPWAKSFILGLLLPEPSSAASGRYLVWQCIVDSQHALRQWPVIVRHIQKHMRCFLCFGKRAVGRWRASRSASKWNLHPTTKRDCVARLPQWLPNAGASWRHSSAQDIAPQARKEAKCEASQECQGHTHTDRVDTKLILPHLLHETSSDLPVGASRKQADL